MGKGGGGGGPQTVTQTNLPEYARPYFENLLERGQAASYGEYVPYEDDRIAGFSPTQTAVQQEISGMQTPGQFGSATDLATVAGIGSLAAGQYTPAKITAQTASAPNLANYSMAAPQNATSQNVTAPTMTAAQTNYAPALEAFQMANPEMFSREQLMTYMSPYMQDVVEVQKRQAIEDAQRTQLMTNLAAPRQGTYGGARQLLAGTERERALGTQLGDIQARGLQSAFENAQQQFERDRASQMTASQQNLASKLGVQQLGTQTGLQAALANLNASQQANVANQAAALQASGMNQEAALRTALANQQAALTTGQANLQSQLQTQQLGAQTSMQAQLANQQANLEAQRLSEQSSQFGSQLGLEGLGQALQAGQVMGQLGTAEQAAELQRLQAQAAVGAEQRSLEQQQLDQQYADFLRQRDYPMEQLGYYSNLLRGLPQNLGSTQTTYAQPPSLASQVGGLGLAGLSLSKLLG
jgi:hypothetical protein